MADVIGTPRCLRMSRSLPDEDSVPPESVRPVWESSVSLYVAEQATLLVPIVVSEPSVFNFHFTTDTRMVISIVDAGNRLSLHDAAFRRLISGEHQFTYRCRGSFETSSNLVHVFLTNDADHQTYVHGLVWP